MKFKQLLHSLYLTRLSQPPSERILYRLIAKHRPLRLVELGLEDAVRAKRLIQQATRYQTEGVTYCGVDWFEAHPDGKPEISLKDAHRELSGQGAKIRLLPGDPYTVLAKQANTLGNTDLLLVGCGHDPEVLERAWRYVPRMLHEQTLVFLEEAATGGKEQGDEEPSLRLLAADEIRALSGARARDIVAKAA